MKALVLFFIFCGLVSCTVDTKVSDLASYSLELKEPLTIQYTSAQKATIQWSVLDPASNSVDLSTREGIVVKILVYDNENCFGNPKTIHEVTDFKTGFDVDNISNDTIYSFKINFLFALNDVFSECSAPVVVDRNAPTTAPPQYPPVDTWVGGTDFDAAIHPATDVGLAGLAPDSYELTLYSGKNCVGSVLNKVTTASTSYRFSGLLHGNFYSVKSVAIDKAGNRSASTCSKDLEIDLFVPSITVNDPTSFPGYTRVANPPIVIGNNHGGTQYCVTHDTNFIPTSALDACPSGAWSPTPPATVTLTNGEGSYTIHVWMADSSNVLITNKPGKTDVIYDATSPSAFSIIGMGGNLDTNFDAWLFTTTTPKPKWNDSASTDTKEYHVSILDGALATVCGPMTVNHPLDNVRMDGCTLTDGVSYKVSIEAMDMAGNIQPAASLFDFTVDLTPPLNFTISGVTGDDESKVDEWLRSLVPQINYADATGEDLYLIRVLDMSDNVVCTDEQENANVLMHNFSSGVACSALSHAVTYKADVVAKDLAGNETRATNAPFQFTVDRVDPLLNFTSTPPALVQVGDADFIFTYSDALSGIDTIECKLNAAGWASCTSPVNLTGLPENSYTYQVRVKDNAGNSTTVSHSWTADLSTPVLTISSQPPAITNQTTGNFTFNATDISGIAQYLCNLNGGGFLACSSPHVTNLAQGSHSIVIRAIDNSNQTADQTVNWLIDTTNPTANIVSMPSAMTNNIAANFVFTSGDTGGAGVNAIDCQLDAGGWGACVSPKNYAALSEASHTFNVRVLDNAGNYSNIETYTWLIDTTNPLVNITSNPSLKTNSTNAGFGFNGSDGSSGLSGFECDIDLGGYLPCSSIQNYAGLSEGNHNFSVRSYDVVGNYSVPATYAWLIDTTAPTISITSNPAVNSNTTSPSFSFTGTDASAGISGYECQIDGGGYSSCVSPKVYAGLSQASHTFNVRSLDQAGNYSAAASYTWLIDTTLPTVSITANPALKTNATGASFSFTGADASSGLSGYECQIDGGGYSLCTSPRNYTGLSQANHTFNVRSLDNAGNYSVVSSYTWLVDTTNPTVSITANPNANTNATSASFSFTGADASAGIASYECQMDGGGYTACTSPRNYTGLSQASHTFNVRSIDQAGNYSSAASYTWLIDTTNPTVSITANPAANSNSTSASFSFTGADASSGLAGYQCQMDGGGYTACTSPRNYAGLSQASHTFNVRSLDNAGNYSAVSSYTWLIDTTLPTVSITANPAANTNSTSASFSFTGSDASSGLAGYQCQIDGGGYSSCVSPKAYAGLSQASHTFNVRSLDNAGNYSVVSSYTWLIDATNPTVSITLGPAANSNSTSANFTFTGADASSGLAGYQCQMDGGGYSSCTSVKSYTGLSQASHTFNVRSLDNAGNYSAAASYTWLIDTTNPTVSITANPAAITNSSSASFSFTGADASSGLAGYQCQMDGGGYSSCVSPKAYTGLSQASHTFNVRSLDNAGNYSAVSTYIWTIDLTGPTTTISAANVGSSNPSFTFNAVDSGGSTVASYYCYLYNATTSTVIENWTACSSGKSYAGIGAATSFIFYVLAYDAVGNAGAATSHSWTNGGWSGFGGWGACSVTCGGGVQYQYRTCTNPAPAGGGYTCAGGNSNSQACNTQSCFTTITYPVLNQNNGGKAGDCNGEWCPGGGNPPDENNGFGTAGATMDTLNYLCKTKSGNIGSYAAGNTHGIDFTKANNKNDNEGLCNYIGTYPSGTWSCEYSCYNCNAINSVTCQVPQ